MSIGNDFGSTYIVHTRLHHLPSRIQYYKYNQSYPECWCKSVRNRPSTKHTRLNLKIVFK